MAAGSGLLANGADSSAPLGRQPPLLDPGARQRAFRPTWSSIVPAPPPRAATGGLCFSVLPTSSAPRSPQQRGLLLTACPSFLPGFGTNVTKFVEWEEGGGNRRTFKKFNKQINKHKSKAAALTDDCRTKHKLNPGLVLSVFHCRRSSFYPSGAPPWDSRPVSGAGVAHYR